MGRESPFELDPARFRALGHRLVDDLGDFLEALASPSSLPVTPGESVAEVRAALGDASLPDRGVPPEEALAEAERLLLDHSLFIGHPRFWGYVVGAPAPIGALGDLLAAAVNPNVGGWPLGPLAAELELQTVRWLAELLGYPADCGGLLVSGGNMANFVGFLAARRAAGGRGTRERGPGERRLRAYCSAETHTWIHKAADMFGLGTEADPLDRDRRSAPAGRRRAARGGRRRPRGRRRALPRRRRRGVGQHGRRRPARRDRRVLPGRGPLVPRRRRLRRLRGLPARRVRRPARDRPRPTRSRSTRTSGSTRRSRPAARSSADRRRSSTPSPTGRPTTTSATRSCSYFEYGPQNSRGFRALKVWLGLKTAGRDGYVEADRRGHPSRAACCTSAVAAEPELEPGPGGPEHRHLPLRPGRRGRRASTWTG